MKVYQLEFTARHACLGGEFRKTTTNLWRSREAAEAAQDAFMETLHEVFDKSPFKPEWGSGKIRIIELKLEDEEAG